MSERNRDCDTTVPLTDEKGELRRQLEEAQQALEESEHRYRELVRCAPAGIYTVDVRRQRFTSVNDAVCRMTGYSREELLAMNPFDLLEGESQARFQTRIDQWLEGGEEPGRSVEYRVKTKEGRILDVLLGVTFTTDDHGKPLTVTVVGYDITERQEAEEAFRESEARLALELAAAQRLQEISTQLIQEEDAEALYDKILDAAAAIMRSDFASLQALRAERGPAGELQLLGQRGFTPEAAQFWEWVRPTSETTCGIALRTGQRVIAADLQTLEFTPGSEDQKTFDQTGIRAVQTTPLISRSGRIVGMISTHWRRPHQPTEGDLCALDVLARQAADLIEHKQAEEELRGANENLRAQAEQLQTANAMLQAKQQEVQAANEDLRVQEEELREHAEALRESEQRYRTLFETAPDAIVVHRDGRFLAANDALLRLAGAGSFQELAGRTVLDFFRPGEREQAAERVRLALAGQRQPIRESTLLRLDGQEVAAELHTGPIDFHGAPAVQTIIRDITERKRAEELLRIKESAIASSLNAIAMADLQGNLTYVNPACVRLWGYEDEREILGRPVLDFWREPDRALEVVQALRNGAGWVGELVAVRKDGSCLSLYLSASTVLNQAGASICMMASFTDITERKRTEEELRQSRARLAWVLERTGVGLWLNELPFGRLTWDEQSRRLFFVAPGVEPTIDLFWGRIHPEDRARTRLAVESALRNHTLYDIEHRAVNPDTGEVRWIRSLGQARYAPDGTPTCFDGINYDITERVKAGEALRESEERYRGVVQNTTAVILRVDPQGIIRFANERALEFFGYSAEELIGKHAVGTIIPGQETTGRDLAAMVDEIAENPDRFHSNANENLRKNGQRVWMEWTNSGIYDEDGRLKEFLAVGIDATERRRAEEALRELNVTLESKVAQRTLELQRRAAQLQKLTLELSQAEERERRRVAVVLHEDLQQQIAGAKFHLRLLNGHSKQELQQDVVQRIDGMLKDAIEKSRRLSYDLSPAVLHMNDLAEVLLWLAKQVWAKHGLTVHVDVLGETILQSESLTMFLFRAAQEVLLNVVKHAGVKEATIRMRRMGRHVCVCISDTGRGFDPQQLKDTPGFGLLAIRERVELLGGRMKIRSIQDRGTAVRIVVPEAPENGGTAR